MAIVFGRKTNLAYEGYVQFSREGLRNEILNGDHYGDRATPAFRAGRAV